MKTTGTGRRRATLVCAPAILAFYIGINNEIQGILDCGVKAISYLIKLFKRQRRWTGISSMYAQHLLLSPPPTL